MIHWAWLIPTLLIGGWLGAAIACRMTGAFATTVEACKDVCPVAAALREENARLRARAKAVLEEETKC